MTTFDEIEKFEITNEEMTTLKRLIDSSDFSILKEIIEKDILKKTYALATGTPDVEFNLVGYLHQLRGIGRYWKSLMFRINKGETNEKS